MSNDPKINDDENEAFLPAEIKSRRIFLILKNQVYRVKYGSVVKFGAENCLSVKQYTKLSVSLCKGS